MKRKRKRRLNAQTLQPLQAVYHIDSTWSMDFISDALLLGRKSRILYLIDHYNREALGIVVEPPFLHNGY